MLVRVHSISQLDNALVKCSGNREKESAVSLKRRVLTPTRTLVHELVVAVPLLADPKVVETKNFRT